MAQATLTTTEAGKAEKVEWGEVQRLILRGYVKLPWAHFLLLRVTDRALSTEWLQSLVESGLIRFGWGHHHDTTPSAAIALTSEGFRALGLDEDTIRGFSPEFVSGADGGDRPRVLRDVNGSAPEKWLWGSEGNRVHVLLALYALTEASLEKLVHEHRELARLGGLEEVKARDGTELGACRPLEDRREHFGFADGIAQPRFRDEPRGVRSRTTREEDRLATGELLLGYPNEVGLHPRSPRLSRKDRERAHLAVPSGDFGRNGSYLVFRQLEQDVPGFWRCLGEDLTSEDRIRVASKMIGRWPDGRPLVERPAAKGVHHDREDFDYALHDPQGTACPIGAHIRRANPRSTLSRDAEKGRAKSKKHRILRRGRSYGRPFVEPLVPTRILEAIEAGSGNPGARGLNFLCFNADISNQFEFIQQSWLNGPVFQGLHGEVDPLAGDPAATAPCFALRGDAPGLKGSFSIPGDPVRSRVHEIPRLIETRGGAYFFVPSQAALRYLGRLR